MRRIAGLLALTVMFLALSPVNAQQRPEGADAGDPTGLPWVTPEVVAPRVSYHKFKSRAANTEVSYHLYTPPVYDQSTSTRFPVLYWLHGTEGGVNHIRPVARMFHFAIRDEGVPPMLVVFVNGLSKRLWTDSKDGRAPVETVFITELIPEIDKSLRTIASREGRILEGFSMGGYGAARIGLRHSQLFGGVSILAAGPLSPEFEGPRANGNPLREKILADVCDGDMAYFKATHPWAAAETQADALRKAGTVIRQAVGSKDFSLDLSRRYHEHLTSLQIPHDFQIVDNVGHDTPALMAGLDNAAFYRKALKVKPAAGDEPKSPPVPQESPEGSKAR